MNPYLPAAKRLALMALGLVAVLALTGELRWGSGAMIGFAGMWVAGALNEHLKVRRASKANGIG